MPYASSRLLFAAVATATCLSTIAQEPAARTEQRGGTFVEPPSKVDPVYLPAGPNRSAETDVSAPRLTLRVALDLPLQRGNAGGGRGAQGSPPGSPTVQAHLRWQPVPGQPWFAQLQLLRYLQPQRQQPWNPDFTYAFGYEDHRAGTFSAFYSNYAGNRFNPDPARGERRFNFARGQWSVGYRFELPALLEPLLLVGDGDGALCSANLHLTPRYTVLAGGGDQDGKTSASLGCRYTHPSGWFAHFTGFGYPRSGQQQPWDPDFTYGLGLAGGAIAPFTLQYANYSGNRFPGRERAAGQGSWRNGSLALSWGTAW